MERRGRAGENGLERRARFPVGMQRARSGASRLAAPRSAARRSSLWRRVQRARLARPALRRLERSHGVQVEHKTAARMASPIGIVLLLWLLVFFFFWGGVGVGVRLLL